MENLSFLLCHYGIRNILEPLDSHLLSTFGVVFPHLNSTEINTAKSPRPEISYLLEMVSPRTVVVNLQAGKPCTEVSHDYRIAKVQSSQIIGSLTKQK